MADNSIHQTNRNTKTARATKAKSHRSGVRRLRERFGHRVDIEWLPPYAPELNPVEQVWNYSKYSQLANFIPDDIDNLPEEVDSSLRYQAGQQNLLRSFFHCAKNMIRLVMYSKANKSMI
ncbi:MAG: hypothetical protein DRP62_08755 [Planctomycetota bacterium]|nr:MAG: hypothetical protein DRP62_08755 [Planctomycetota bacterium]